MWLALDCIESMFTEFLPGLQVMTSSPVQKTWILQSTHPQPRQTIYIFQSPHFRVKFNLRTNPKGPQFSSLRSKSGFDWIRFGHMRCTMSLASPFLSDRRWSSWRTERPAIQNLHIFGWPCFYFLWRALESLWTRRIYWHFLSHLQKIMKFTAQILVH